MHSWASRLHLPTFAVAAVIVIVWSAVSARYGAYVLPSPRHVLAGLGEILVSGDVWKHTGASLHRIVIGFGGMVAVMLATDKLVFDTLSRRLSAWR